MTSNFKNLALTFKLYQWYHSTKMFSALLTKTYFLTFIPWKMSQIITKQTAFCLNSWQHWWLVVALSDLSLSMSLCVWISLSFTALIRCQAALHAQGQPPGWLQPGSTKKQRKRKKEMNALRVKSEAENKERYGGKKMTARRREGNK